MKKFISWKTFFLLLTLGLTSVVCVIPYILTVQGEVLKSIGLPIELILAAQLVQSTFLFAITISLGLFFTKRIGFRLPLLEADLGKDCRQSVWKSIAGISIISGILVAVAIYTLDYLFTGLGAALSTQQNLAPVWQKLLAAFYGGITEEILMRLFLMSFFVWIGMKVFRQNKPNSTNIVISILLASVIFGLGHLPITASLVKLDALIVIRAIVLNGIGGVVFGWLFWKKGLESAMLAHFTADVFLLSLLPLVFN